MPKALASQETVRRDLQYCPPDGFVVLKKMNYGQVLKSRSLASKIDTPVEGDKSKSMQLEMTLDKQAVYDFSVSIMDHNLEDEEGKKLNMADISTVQRLDPQVAQEIEGYINELNNPEEAPKA